MGTIDLESKLSIKSFGDINATAENFTDVIQEKDVKEEVVNTNSRYGPPTDGGYGWVVVTACFFLLFTVLGVAYSFAIFLQYYAKYKFAGKADLATLSFIGTLATALVTLCTVVTGRISDKLGYRLCILLGGTIFSLGLLLASFSTEVWQLLLTQGVMVGIGGSITFPSSVSAPSQWFLKKRGLATGIAVSGSGIGGLIIAPLTQVIIDTLGAEWALRILAILSFVIITICAFIIRERTEPQGKKASTLDFSIIKDKRFLCMFFAGFTSSFGFLVPFYLITKYSIDIGLSPSEGALLAGLLNGGSAIGRILLGFLADYAGRINLIFFSALLAALSCFLIWTFSTTFATLAVFSVIYGIAAGGYLSIAPVVIAGQFGIAGLASLIGIIYFGTGIPSLVGTPIAAAILNSTTSVDGNPNYIPLIVYSGVSALVSSLFLLYLRFIVSKKLLHRV